VDHRKGGEGEIVVLHEAPLADLPQDDLQGRTRAAQDDSEEEVSYSAEGRTPGPDLQPVQGLPT